MNLHFPFFGKKQAHAVPRYHAATKAENREALARRVNVACQLAVYVATTTPELRKADADAMTQRLREGR